MNELTEELTKRPRTIPEQALLNNERINKNSGNTKLVLRCLFGKYVTASLDIIKFHEKLNQYVMDIGEVRKRAEEAEQRLKLNELQYEISLTKLNKEYEKNQLLLIKEQIMNENEYDANEYLDPGEADRVQGHSPSNRNSPRNGQSNKPDDFASMNQEESPNEIRHGGQGETGENEQL